MAHKTGSVALKTMEPLRLLSSPERLLTGPRLVITYCNWFHCAIEESNN